MRGFGGFAPTLLALQLPAGVAAPGRTETVARPLVAFNSNSAGCVVPHIDRYAVGTRRVDVTLTLARPRDPPKDFLCTCRGGAYYASVFPSAKALAADSAWRTAPRPYRTPIGYAVLPHRPLPWTGTLHFPLFKTGGAAYPFYYLDLGCP